MTHLIYVQLRNDEGALERVLRVTRHRGFSIQGLMVQAARGGEAYDVTLRVDSARPLRLLCSQIAKLVEVDRVTELAEAAYAHSA